MFDMLGSLHNLKGKSTLRRFLILIPSCSWITITLHSSRGAKPAIPRKENKHLSLTKPKDFFFSNYSCQRFLRMEKRKSWKENQKEASFLCQSQKDEMMPANIHRASAPLILVIIWCFCHRRGILQIAVVSRGWLSESGNPLTFCYSATNRSECKLILLKSRFFFADIHLSQMMYRDVCDHVT